MSFFSILPNCLRHGTSLPNTFNSHNLVRSISTKFPPSFRSQSQKQRIGRLLKSDLILSQSFTRPVINSKSRFALGIHQQRWQTQAQPPIANLGDSSQSEQYLPDTISVRQPSISSAILYLLAFGSLAFGVAAYSSLKNTSEVAKKLEDRSLLERLSSALLNTSSILHLPQDDFAEYCWGAGVTPTKLMLMNDFLQFREAGEGLKYLQDSSLPASIKVPLAQAYQTLAEKVLNISPAQKAVMPIIFVNTLIFLLWARSGWSTRLLGFLSTNFLHRPTSGMTHTLLTSTFSHQAFWHFGFNNFALWTFGGMSLAVAAHEHAAKNDIPVASTIPQFVAFFATAGVFAAAASHIVTALGFRSVVQRLGLAKAAQTFGPQASLGSSGAIWAVIAMTACIRPDSSVSLILLPFVAIPIKFGVAGLIALDAVGIIRGWQVFDHVAHLGGAFFGFLYYYFGAQSWAAIKMWVAQVMQVGPYDPVRTRSQTAK